MPTRSEQPIPLGFGIDRDTELTLHEGHCIRSISPDVSEFFKGFVESDCAAELVQAGMLIESQVVDFDSNGVLKVRHPEIPFVLYPFEWTPSMLRDAALALLDLVESLEKHGYTLKDGHPWNMLFSGTQPTWVDLTSIGKVDDVGPFPARPSFIDYFIGPMRLFAADLAPLARLVLAQYLGPPPVWLNSDLALTAGRAFSHGRKSGMKHTLGATWKAIQYKFASRFSASDPFELPTSIDGLRAFVSDMAVEPRPGMWTDYYCGKNELPQFDPKSTDFKELIQSTPKHQLIYSLLQNDRPKSLLDIGCNTGLYSFMAESLGASVIGLDTDERAADQMYLAAKKANAKIITGCVDFVTPIRATEYLHKPRVRSLHERTRADTVLCLAVVHHWVFKRTQLLFQDVVDILAGITERTLIVEFVPPGDKHIEGWISARYSWYTLEGFVNELGKSFATVEVHESYPEPRKLLVCRK